MFSWLFMTSIPTILTIPADLLGQIVDYVGSNGPFIALATPLQIQDVERRTSIAELLLSVRLGQIERVWEITEVLRGRLLHSHNVQSGVWVYHAVRFIDGLVLCAEMLRGDSSWRTMGCLPTTPQAGIVETLIMRCLVECKRVESLMRRRSEIVVDEVRGSELTSAAIR